MYLWQKVHIQVTCKVQFFFIRCEYCTQSSDIILGNYTLLVCLQNMIMRCQLRHDLMHHHQVQPVARVVTHPFLSDVVYGGNHVDDYIAPHPLVESLR